MSVSKLKRICFMMEFGGSLIGLSLVLLWKDPIVFVGCTSTWWWCLF